jgi:site-specific recombinase XerD
LRDYQAWGGRFPAQPQDIVAYVTERANVLRIATLKRRLIGIGMAHVMAGASDPTRSAVVRKLLRGVQRVHGVAQRRAVPITEVELGRMFEGVQALPELRDRALLWLGFAAALRRSEIVGLDVQDLVFGGSGVTVRLRRSKTDQFGRSRLIGVPNEAGGRVAIATVRAWLDASGLREGALFRRVLVSGQLGPRLSDQSVNLMIKRYAQSVGLAAEGISGHSLRAGFVTSAVRAGASLVSIQRQTGHASLDMLARYIRELDLFTGNALTHMGRVGAVSVERTDETA